MYHSAWSLIRVPPNQDDRSSEGNVRCVLADGTQKSSTPHSPMKKENDAADKKGCMCYVFQNVEMRSVWSVWSVNRRVGTRINNQHVHRLGAAGNQLSTVTDQVKVEPRISGNACFEPPNEKQNGPL